MFTQDLLHLHCHTRELSEPSILILIDTPRYPASISCVWLLSFKATAASSHATLRFVHCLLQRVILPAEDVVAVLAKAGIISRAEDKRL